MRWTALAFAAALACAATGVFALGASGSHPECSTTSASTPHYKAAPGVARDSHGRIARDPRQLNAFKREHPCPATGKTYGSCPGYTVDHVIPLKRGGADGPSNMQWQTTAEAKAKDRWE
jgi:hypothetical protein